MTTNLTTSKLFEGHEIRGIESGGEVWIPIRDLSKAWGLDRTTIRKHISRNMDIFEGYVHGIHDGDILSHDEELKNDVFVNEAGLYQLIARVSKTRLKNPAIRDAIIRFRKDIPKLIQQFRKAEIQEQTLPAVQIPQKQIGDMVREHLKIADALCEFGHVDRGIATSIALSRVEFETGIDLSTYKNLIPRGKQQPFASLTPTQMGKELGMAATTVNKILTQLGYQYLSGRDWQPTHVGSAYSEAYPVTGITEKGKSYSRWQLKWSPKMIEILREKLFGIAEMRKQENITEYI